MDDLEQLKRENAELREAVSHLRTELLQAQKLTSVGCCLVDHARVQQHSDHGDQLRQDGAAA